MIRYFCDRCDKEIEDNGRKMYVGAYDALGMLITTIGQPKHLCEECSAKLDAIKDQLKCEEDIFNMADEDVELLRYAFKVGDEVITDDGCVGTITDICTCDHCKKRGFYEPIVQMKIGSQIYITDTDKENGFISYYKIGDRVFGNINDKHLWKHRETYQKAIEEIDAQLGVIESIKHN